MPDKLIKKYSLQPHPEGGWYCQTYRSSETVQASALPDRFGGDRTFGTAIYFLLEKNNFSAFHRIKSDEIWHFYAGGPLLIHVINPTGVLTTVVLGNDILSEQHFQYVVPAGCWFASEPAPDTVFSFVGCTVSPGFDFADFELGDKEALSQVYPQHRGIINRLCR